MTPQSSSTPKKDIRLLGGKGRYYRAFWSDRQIIIGDNSKTLYPPRIVTKDTIELNPGIELRRCAIVSKLLFTSRQKKHVFVIPSFCPPFENILQVTSSKEVVTISFLLFIYSHFFDCCCWIEIYFTRMTFNWKSWNHSSAENDILFTSYRPPSKRVILSLQRTKRIEKAAKVDPLVL